MACHSYEGIQIRLRRQRSSLVSTASTIVNSATNSNAKIMRFELRVNSYALLGQTQCIYSKIGFDENICSVDFISFLAWKVSMDDCMWTHVLKSMTFMPEVKICLFSLVCGMLMDSTQFENTSNLNLALHLVLIIFKTHFIISRLLELCISTPRSSDWQPLTNVSANSIPMNIRRKCSISNRQRRSRDRWQNWQQGRNVAPRLGQRFAVNLNRFDIFLKKLIFNDALKTILVSVFPIVSITDGWQWFRKD